MSRSTPRSAWTVVSPWPYWRTMPRASTTVEVDCRRAVFMPLTVPARCPRRNGVCSSPGVRKRAPRPARLSAQEGENRQYPAVIIRSGGDAQPVEDARHVLLDAALGDRQAVGDALVGATLRHQLEHLALACGD